LILNAFFKRIKPEGETALYTRVIIIENINMNMPSTRTLFIRQYLASYRKRIAGQDTQGGHGTHAPLRKKMIISLRL
jgi:hypothetical protein